METEAQNGYVDLTKIMQLSGKAGETVMIIVTTLESAYYQQHDKPGTWLAFSH